MGRRTSLYDAHVTAAGRMVEFAGFDLPVQYTGVVDEHQAVRTGVGLFDVSHMGEVVFEGPDALASLNRLVTNDLTACPVGRSLYNAICLPDGGIVDDTVVYRLGERRLLVCVNAANRAKDLAWLSEHATGDVVVRDESDETTQIAVQGPAAARTLAPICDAPVHDLPPFSQVSTRVAGRPAVVARTGYTGEDGFELFCGNEQGPAIWAALLEAGEAHGAKPCGLGARDSLRLEARLCLYGNDIDETTTPLEAGLGFVVKLDKDEFIGREALARQKAEGVPRRLVGFEVEGRGIARQGYTILSDGEPVGQVTSGTMSPTLGRAIGLGYVPWALRTSGTPLAIDVRGRPVPARVVKTPFYRRPNTGSS